MKLRLFVIMLMALVALAGCGLKSPHFKGIDNLSVISLSSNRLELSADLLLYNPNKTSYILKEVNLDVYTENNVKLTDLKQVLNTEMLAKSDFSIPITISFDSKKLISDSGGILGSVLYALGNKKIQLLYKGSCKIEKHGLAITIPIDSKVQFELHGNSIKEVDFN